MRVPVKFTMRGWVDIPVPQPYSGLQLDHDVEQEVNSAGVTIAIPGFKDEYTVEIPCSELLQFDTDWFELTKEATKKGL